MDLELKKDCTFESSAKIFSRRPDTAIGLHTCWSICKLHANVLNNSARIAPDIMEKTSACLS